ncbi:MAG: CidA/LrgA family protein [Motiliproteus sp.]|nr:CidA/LrgA family protein [Motiliproteus sp.]MCW9053653.1 CidA/LrgA family protein [Motiliproteus sp.]
MVFAMAQIMVFWVLGESLHYLTDIPISGSVLGMLMLFFYLMIRQNISLDLEKTSQALISQLTLLLLPGGVGLFFLGERMQGQWLPLLISIFVGSILSIILSLLLMKQLVKRKGL